MMARQQVQVQVSLSELLCLSGTLSCEPSFKGVMVSGIQLDSRKIKPGDLFIAVPGEQHDGRQFIEQAVANGAVAVVAEPPVNAYVDAVPVPLLEQVELSHELGKIAARFYSNPSHSLRMVGITGTNGKTTTSWLAAQLARLMGKRCGVIGTLGASLDDDVAETANTTPDAVTLQRKLADWRDERVSIVCMEVSSHALVQGRVSGVAFNVAIFTNLSRDHLDYHGSMDAYGQAKLQLFADQELSHAVVNLDDSYSAKLMVALDEGTRLISYSASGNPAADVVVEGARFHAGGVHAHIKSPWGSGEISSPLVGEFNLENLAAAIAAIALLSDDFSGLLSQVENLKPVPGRMQAIPNDRDIQLIVDYAHTPDALEQVLLALRPHVEGRLITVFGCGGDRDEGKRAVMGRIASELSDSCIVTSDNPRGEDPLAIMRDIESGCGGHYSLIEDRATAIRQAIHATCAGDCVLIAGKGHEDYQLVGSERLYFSDEEQVLLALAERGSP